VPIDDVKSTENSQFMSMMQSSPEMDQIFKSSKMTSVSQNCLRFHTFLNAVFQSGNEITLHASAEFKNKV